MPGPAHIFTSADGDVIFAVVALAPGLYAIEATGPGVLAVCPTGGAYTMNIAGRGRYLDPAELEAAVIDRWDIVLRETAPAVLEAP